MVVERCVMRVAPDSVHWFNTWHRKPVGWIESWGRPGAMTPMGSTSALRAATTSSGVCPTSRPLNSQCSQCGLDGFWTGLDGCVFHADHGVEQWFNVASCGNAPSFEVGRSRWPIDSVTSTTAMSLQPMKRSRRYSGSMSSRPW